MHSKVRIDKYPNKGSKFFKIVFFCLFTNRRNVKHPVLNVPMTRHMTTLRLVNKLKKPSLRFRNFNNSLTLIFI